MINQAHEGKSKWQQLKYKKFVEVFAWIR